MNTFMKVSTVALAFGFAAIDGCTVTAAEFTSQTEAEIAAQIREFEKGAAESAIKYKDELIPLSPCDITVSQFMRTSQRMTISQVESVLGCFNIPTATWQGSIGTHGNVQIHMNDLTIHKSQPSLR